MIKGRVQGGHALLLPTEDLAHLFLPAVCLTVAFPLVLYLLLFVKCRTQLTCRAAAPPVILPRVNGSVCYHSWTAAVCVSRIPYQALCVHVKINIM